VTEQYKDDKVIVTCQVDEEVLGQAARLGATRLHGDDAILNMNPLPEIGALEELGNS
jgi:hypothetical protein